MSQLRFLSPKRKKLANISAEVFACASQNDHLHRFVNRRCVKLGLERGDQSR